HEGNMADVKDDGLAAVADGIANGKTPGSGRQEEAAARGPKLFLVHLEPRSANLGQTLVLARALHAENWDVHIVCRVSCRLAEAARACSLPVHTIPDTADGGLLSAWSLVRLVHKLGARKRVTGLLHACDPAASHLVSRAWRLDKKLRVVHTRRMPIMETSAKVVRWYKMPPAKIITDSLAGKIAMRLSGLEPHLLHTIASGIDPSEQPARRERSDGRVIFAVTGELLPSGGHSLLFDALAFLDKETDLPPWEVRILGEGPYFQALLEEAQDKNVARRIAFLGGADTPAQLTLCDILVLPASEGESHMPLVLQGWAARLPIVAINRLDHAENFQAEGNCLLAQPGDARGLADRMARLARDATLCAPLVAGGRASLAKFSVRAMVLDYKRLYRQILA
ncbi:MAG: glycosyltransferase family 4 protein, partial [Deltaproteobacteria bacterium]|nr:glycosyltransferase family 4 protein [Deltaproteobacteria bacterium]